MFRILKSGLRRFHVYSNNIQPKKYFQIPLNKIPNDCSKGNIKIICYWNGMWNVCPNPENNKLIEEFEKKNNKDHFVEKRVYYITEEQLSNPENWSP